MAELISAVFTALFITFWICVGVAIFHVAFGRRPR
jgi:hypothetical protein